MKTLICLLALAFLIAGCEEYRITAGRDVTVQRGTPTGSDDLPGMPGSPCKSDDDCLSGDCANTVGVCR